MQNIFWHMICSKQVNYEKNLKSILELPKRAYIRLFLLLAISILLYFQLPYLMFLLAFLGLMPALIICIVEVALELISKKLLIKMSYCDFFIM